MVMKILHDNEVGKFLTIGPDGKLNGMNAFKSAVVQGNNIVFTLLDDTTVSLALPAQAIDVKLQGAEITEDNKLKLTLSNGDIVEADLAKFVDAPKSASEYFTEIKALPEFKAAVLEFLKSAEGKAAMLEVLKGEEVQDFAGNSKGYLLPAA